MTNWFGFLKGEDVHPEQQEENKEAYLRGNASEMMHRWLRNKPIGEAGIEHLRLYVAQCGGDVDLAAQNVNVTPQQYRTAASLNEEGPAAV